MIHAQFKNMHDNRQGYVSASDVIPRLQKSDLSKTSGNQRRTRSIRNLRKNQSKDNISQGLFPNEQLYGP
jgi:hypothetical protein